MTPDWLTTLIGLGAVRFYYSDTLYWVKVPPDGFAAWEDEDACWGRARFGGVLGDTDRMRWDELGREQQRDFVRFATDLGLDQPANQIRVLQEEADDTHAQITDLSARHGLLMARLRAVQLEGAMTKLTARLQEVQWVFENGNLTIHDAMPGWLDQFSEDFGLQKGRDASAMLDEGVTAYLGDRDIALVFSEPEAMRRFCTKHRLWKRVEWSMLAYDIEEVEGERNKMAEWIAGWREFQKALNQEVVDEVDPV
jgi:hypothetical protein